MQKTFQVTLPAAFFIEASQGARVNLPSKDRLFRAHDVAVAYRLAMAKVWVQLPLGALNTNALVVQLVRTPPW